MTYTRGRGDRLTQEAHRLLSEMALQIGTAAGIGGNRIVGRDLDAPAMFVEARAGRGGGVSWR